MLSTNIVLQIKIKTKDMSQDQGKTFWFCTQGYVLQHLSPPFLRMKAYIQ